MEDFRNWLCNKDTTANLGWTPKGGSPGVVLENKNKECKGGLGYVRGTPKTRNAKKLLVAAEGIGEIVVAGPCLSQQRAHFLRRCRCAHPNPRAWVSKRRRWQGNIDSLVGSGRRHQFSCTVELRANVFF